MDHPLEALAWEMRRLFRELTQAAERALEPLGVTAAQRALIEFLAREPQPVTISELARRRAVSRQHIHQSLASMDPRWIERIDDPADARLVTLRLSRHGASLWKRIQAIDAAVLDQLMKGLGEREVRAATVTLRKLRAAINSLPEP